MRRRALLASTGAALLLGLMPALPVASPASTPNPTRLAIYRRAVDYLDRHPGLRVGQALWSAAFHEGLYPSRVCVLWPESPYLDDSKLGAFARLLTERFPDEPR